MLRFSKFFKNRNAWQCKYELAAAGGIIFDPDTAVMRFNNQFAKSETEAGSANGSAPQVGAREAVEHLLAALWRDAGATVLNDTDHALFIAGDGGGVWM